MSLLDPDKSRLDSGDLGVGASISKGAVWMVALRWSIKGMGLFSTILLARLLVPEDFGLVALAMSVYALVRLIREFGFAAALIQNQSATREYYDTAWTLNVILSAIAAVILFLVTPSAADWYGDSRLGPMLHFLAALFFITGFSNIAVVDFQKNMTFDKVFWLRVIPKVSSVLITLVAAYYLRSYWALLLGQAFNSLSSLFLSYLMHSFRPRWCLSAYRQLFGFSSWLMFNNLVKYLNRHGRNILLAKLGGAPVVGLMSIATDFATIVSMELVRPIDSAAFPGYSKLSHDREKLREAFLGVMEVIAVIAVPGGIGIAAVAPVFVPVLLGEKWLAAIELMVPIAFASVFMSFMTANDGMLMALAKQKITTLAVTLRVILFFVLIVVLWEKLGVVGVAYAVLISNVAVYPVYFPVLKSLLEVSIRDQYSIMQRPVLASLVMYVLLGLVLQHFEISTTGFGGLAALLMLVLIGVLTYSAVLYALWFIQGRSKTIEHRILERLIIARACGKDG